MKVKKREKTAGLFGNVMENNHKKCVADYHLSPLHEEFVWIFFLPLGDTGNSIFVNVTEVIRSYKKESLLGYNRNA